MKSFLIQMNFLFQFSESVVGKIQDTLYNYIITEDGELFLPRTNYGF